MGSPSNLKTLLETTLGSSFKVYFQPPASVLMQYPCVVFERSNGRTKFADNIPFSVKIRYTITLMDRDPDSSGILKIMGLPTCVFDRHFTSDNLNHDVFYMFY